MQWIILFIVSWALFITLADWKELRKNIWCGLLAVTMQTAIDSHAISHGNYIVNNPVVKLWGSSLFFVIGPVLAIGTLLAQFHPRKNWAIVVYTLTIAGLFTIEELFLMATNMLEYINWHLVDSVVVNICAMAVLSWFSIVVLNKRERSTK